MGNNPNCEKNKLILVGSFWILKDTNIFITWRNGSCCILSNEKIIITDTKSGAIGEH